MVILQIRNIFLVRRIRCVASSRSALQHSRRIAHCSFTFFDSFYCCFPQSPFSIQAVGGFHLFNGTPVQGTLDDGGNVLTVNGVALDPEVFTNVIGTSGQDYDFSVRSTDGVPFRGALVRFAAVSTSDFAVVPAANAGTADVCTLPEQGVTHTSNAFKTELGGTLMVPGHGYRVEFTVDVTVVDFNNDDSGSQFWYSQYIVAVEAGPTAAPSAKPTALASESPTLAPTATASSAPTVAPNTSSPTPAPSMSPTVAPPKRRFSICFSGDMTVQLECGATKRMSEVEIGDRVKVHGDSKYEAVYGYAKHEP